MMIVGIFGRGTTKEQPEASPESNVFIDALGLVCEVVLTTGNVVEGVETAACVCEDVWASVALVGCCVVLILGAREALAAGFNEFGPRFSLAVAFLCMV
jgi:hypothetical protein